MKYFAENSKQHFPFRIYMELFYIIDRHEVSATALCNEFNINKKTFIKDLQLVLILANYFGIRIINDLNVLYYTVSNEKLFNSLVNRCCIFFHTHRRIINDYKIRFALIILKQLLSDKPINKEQLATELNFSLSNLRLELKMIESYFKSYDLSINHQTKQIGFDSSLEFKQRLAIISSLMYVDYKLMFLEYNDPKVIIFLNNIIESDTIENIKKIKDILKKYYINMSLERSYYILLYLIVSHERIANGKKIKNNPNISFSSNIIFAAYELANLFNIKDSLEINSISVCLSVFQDYHHVMLTQNTIELSKALRSYLKLNWDITIPPNLLTYFNYELFRIELKNTLHLLEIRFLKLNDNPNLKHQNSILLKISLEINNIINSWYNHTIYKNHLNELNNIIGLVIESYVCKLLPLNIGIIPFSSYQALKISSQLSKISNIQLQIIEDEKQINNFDIVIADYAINNQIKNAQYFITYQGITPRIMNYIKHRATTNFDLSCISSIKIIKHDLMISNFNEFIKLINDNYNVKIYNDSLLLRQHSYKDTIVFIDNQNNYDFEEIIIGSFYKTIYIDKKVYSKYLIIKYKPTHLKNKIFAMLSIKLQMDNTSFSKLLYHPTKENLFEIIKNSLN